MHVVIFSGGTFQKSLLTEQILQKADLIIAADMGAATAFQVGIVPKIVIGDFDSLDIALQKKLQEKGSTHIPYSQEKNETDTELALRYAVQQGATKITILGGNSGDRFDHIIANMLLSFTISFPVFFVDGNQTSWIEKGPVVCQILGKKGDLLSLIPINGDVAHVTTENLYYPLRDDTLVFGKPRGISNVFRKSKAIVSFTAGSLLVVHTQK